MTANTASPQPTDSVNVFGFGARVSNALDREHIRTVADLLACDWMRLTDIPSFGVTMLNEVIQTLAKHDLKLKETSVPLPQPPRPLRSDERVIREQVAKDLLAVDPAEWALAGQRAGSMAARIARGEAR
jgi:hypothetical protein